MGKSRVFRIGAVVAVLVFTVTIAAVSLTSASPNDWFFRNHVRHVTIPKEDRFVPFELTIHQGDTVTWINNDTDDHTVVSDSMFDSAGHKGVDMVIKGTLSNHGMPGTFSLRFTHAGSFVYYCRFHAALDSAHQPVAPGPKGGLQDAKGNFGTPMSGVIVVLDDVP
ncbi:MAG TPA: plastocyanin/azurin family copper-binding protein [Anaerolineae bacterium]|jgi:plastocyanin